MPKIVKLDLGEEEYDAIEQRFEIVREDWNEYRPLDGGTVRVKTTVHKIYRSVDSQGRQLYNEEGEPRIIIRHKADVVFSEQEL